MASRGVNKVILIGNLGADPDIRYMPSGEPVANLSLATSESWKDSQSGELREKTEWHRVVAFRKLAEIIGQYCKKGSKLYIEGRLQTRKWQDQNGQDRYTTEIVADQMQMLDSRGSGGGGDGYSDDPGYGSPQPPRQNNPQNNAPSNYGQASAPSKPKPQNFGPEVNSNFDDDDIPF